MPFSFLRWSAVDRLLGFSIDYSDCARSRVFLERGGCDWEGDFQEADGLAGCKAEVIVGVNFAEVAALDVDFSCERDGVCLLTMVISLHGLVKGRAVAILGKWKGKNTYSIRRVLGKGYVDHFKVIFRQVIDDDSERLEHKHESWYRKLEIMADSCRESLYLDIAGRFRHA